MEIERFTIELDCRRLLLQSIRLFDQRDWRGYVELFTSDGTFVRANQPDEPLVGQAAIRTALGARRADRLTRHLCTNIEIEVLDPRHANGRCYLMLFSATEQTSEHPATGWPADTGQKIGDYLDEYVRTDLGWQIARRVGRLTMYTG